MFKKIIFGISVACSFHGFALAENTSHAFDEDAIVTEQPNVATGMKSKTTQSGYCCTLLDVTKSGDVENVRVTFCTNDVLESGVKYRVEKFRFKPAMKNGQPVLRKDKRYNQSYFRFDDSYEAGMIPIPGPDRYLEPIKPLSEIPPKPEDFENRILWVEEYFNNKMICLMQTV